MEPTVQAILARFDGDYADAIEYCEYIAWKHEWLRAEYRAYREVLMEGSCA